MKPFPIVPAIPMMAYTIPNFKSLILLIIIMNIIPRSSITLWSGARNLVQWQEITYREKRMEKPKQNGQGKNSYIYRVAPKKVSFTRLRYYCVKDTFFETICLYLLKYMYCRDSMLTSFNSSEICCPIYIAGISSLALPLRLEQNWYNVLIIALKNL